jgi:hypothetical protein
MNLISEDFNKKQAIFTKYTLNDPSPNASLLLFIKNQDACLKNAFNILSYCFYYLEYQPSRTQANMEATQKSILEKVKNRFKLTTRKCFF